MIRGQDIDQGDAANNSPVTKNDEVVNKEKATCKEDINQQHKSTKEWVTKNFIKRDSNKTNTDNQQGGSELSGSTFSENQNEGIIGRAEENDGGTSNCIEEDNMKGKSENNHNEEGDFIHMKDGSSPQAQHTELNTSVTEMALVIRNENVQMVAAQHYDEGRISEEGEMILEQQNIGVPATDLNINVNTEQSADNLEEIASKK